jgi:O-antigen ligase
LLEEAIRRGWENIIGRPDGPMAFRFIFQPLMAAILAVRAGLNDARKGRTAFLWTLVRDPAQRSELMRDAWKDVGRVFLLAVILDAIYQLITQKWIYPLELLVTAALLAIVPYVLIRGPVTRIAARLRRRSE